MPWVPVLFCFVMLDGAVVAAFSQASASTSRTAATKSSKPATKASVNHKQSGITASAKSAGAKTVIASASHRTTGRRTSRISRVTPAAPTYQLHPDPERYQQIQQALAERGYFKGQVNGEWGDDSVDALKRFQSDQKLPDDGKINALSLIGLGLGPKHDGSSSVSATGVAAGSLPKGGLPPAGGSAPASPLPGSPASPSDTLAVPPPTDPNRMTTSPAGPSSNASTPRR